MKMTRLQKAAAVMFCFFALTGGAGWAATELPLGCGTTSSYVYAFSVAMSEVINPKLKDIALYPESTAGSSAHYAMLKNEAVLMATGSIFTDYQALNGEGRFKEKHDEIRSMFPISLSVCQIVVRADSGINKMQDLNDKRVAIGGRGSPTSVMSENVLAALNINAKVSTSTHGEMIEMFQDGRADAIIYFGGAPYSGIIDVSSSTRVKLLGMTDEELEAVRKMMPALSVGSVSKEAYNFMDEDVKTVRSMITMLIHKSVSEKDAYAVTKCAFDNWGEIVKVVPAAAVVKPSDVAGMGFPLHPGALKWYAENGVEVPERLKK